MLTASVMAPAAITIGVLTRLKSQPAKASGRKREPRREPTVRVGDREAILPGLGKRHDFDDFSHRSMKTTWRLFVLGAAVVFACS